MSDKIMEDIKKGKGLPPLSNNSTSNTQSGMTTEQREHGITHETFTYHDENKTENPKGNE